MSRNVYWLSTKPDVLDYAHTDWFHTPTTAYADLKGLAAMPQGDGVGERDDDGGSRTARRRRR